MSWSLGWRRTPRATDEGIRATTPATRRLLTSLPPDHPVGSHPASVGERPLRNLSAQPIVARRIRAAICNRPNAGRLREAGARRNRYQGRRTRDDGSRDDPYSIGRRPWHTHPRDESSASQRTTRDIAVGPLRGGRAPLSGHPLRAPRRAQTTGSVAAQRQDRADRPRRRRHPRQPAGPFCKTAAGCRRRCRQPCSGAARHAGDGAGLGFPGQCGDPGRRPSLEPAHRQCDRCAPSNRNPGQRLGPARAPRAVERHPETRRANRRCAPSRSARLAGQPGSAKGSAAVQEGTPLGEEHMTTVDEAPARAKHTREETKSGADRQAKPRRPAVKPRGSLITALDVGTTKTCCFIARVESDRPRVLGIGHQISREIRNGGIVDLEATSASVLNAVHAAEEMAGETIQRVVANLSGGFSASRIIRAEIGVTGREITDAEMRRVLEHGYLLREPGDRQVIHSVPVGFSVDDSRGIRDPRGMLGERLGVNMHVVTASAAGVRNHASAIGRSHLEVEALVVSPYASGLSCLVEDEIGLGVTVIDMGGGTTTIGVFFDGNLIFADYVPVGGAHVTNDIARGLSTGVAHAERMKTLFGSAISTSTDEREMIAVPQIGEEEEGHVNHVPKSLLVGIIAPRIEETFELVRNRLEASGFDKVAGRRVVLTGGACQLHGARELAALILDKQVRIGRPLRVSGLAEATGGTAFSTAVGLLHFALSERAEVPRAGRGLATEPTGFFGRFGHWLRENF